MHDLRFKPVTTDDELQQIHTLNHSTFAAELGQYEVNASGELVDRYHGLNIYFVAKHGDEVVGMVTINNTAPFSIEKRLSDPKSQLSSFSAPSEIRMLAIKPSYRNSMVVGGLFWQVFAEAQRRGRSHLLISGIMDRAAMYRSLGFRDLGDAVPAGDVSYIPMAMQIDDSHVSAKAARFREWWQRRVNRSISLMPGPVAISSEVMREFARPPVSHRSEEMIAVYGEVRARLGEIANGMHVALMTGSGTLANDAVAAVLYARFSNSRGLVLSNGEFGERLVRQARCTGLNFDTLQWGWGEAWDLNAIEDRLDNVAWIWCVHLETSTGQLNHLAALSQRCEAHGVALAADCVSSLGAVSLEGCNLALASTVSGKAFGAYAGLAIVFADDSTLAESDFSSVPNTFDLARNIAQPEPMFTIASPQLRALHRTLQDNYSNADACAKRYCSYQKLSTWVREQLRKIGLPAIVDDGSAAPVISTFILRDVEVSRRCEEAGYQIAHESSYLKQRGWGQISVMGDLTRHQIAGVFELL